MHPLTSFAVSPPDIKFETQEEAEEVILFMRQHFIVNFGWIVLVFTLILAPSVLLPVFINLLPSPLVIPPNYLFVGTVFWYVVTFGFALAKFLGWYFNIYIVTNERVVDIDFVNLLYKQFSEARLDKIQDVSYTTGGIFATVFNYGDVHIQTAAEVPEFEFLAVPFPERVVQTIGELAKEKGGSL